jgi:hypothetical protein
MKVKELFFLLKFAIKICCKKIKYNSTDWDHPSISDEPDIFQKNYRKSDNKHNKIPSRKITENLTTNTIKYKTNHHINSW